MIEGLRNWFFEQLAMYAAYHRDRRNQMTHHVGVPLIVFSILLVLEQVGFFHVGDAEVTAAAALLSILLVLYLVAVPAVGVIAVALYGAMYVLATFINRQPADLVWLVVAAAFIAGWIIQFVGHVFEGRRPALTVNALQIFMAPPFLIAEVLFALGRQAKLRAAIEARAGRYLP